MQNLFVNENDEFIVKFVVATNQDGTIFCDINKDSLIELLESMQSNIDGFEIHDYKAVFKKPSFGDTLSLYDSIFSLAERTADVNFNPVKARLNKIVSLIKSWNLKGKEEKPTEEEIRQLHPVIANAIGIQVDLETGGILT